MGVVNSIPSPIKFQLKQIDTNSEEYILDSQVFFGEVKYIIRACKRIAKVKRIKRLILKLYIINSNDDNLAKAVIACMKNIQDLIIYGSGLRLLENCRFETAWRECRLRSLSIKAEISDEAFTKISIALKTNKYIKSLHLKYLNFTQIDSLCNSLSVNTTLEELAIIYESRNVDLSDNESSISITSHASTTLSQSTRRLLQDNSSIKEYRLGGYIEGLALALHVGLNTNQSVNKIIYENIDMDRDALSPLTYLFSSNSTINEIQILRGCNTIAAVVLFRALKQSKSVQKVSMVDCTFNTAGFGAFEDMLSVNTSILHIDIKNLLNLSFHCETPDRQIRNFVHILNGLEKNSSILSFKIADPISVLNTPTETACFSSYEVADAIYALITKNTTLKSLTIENFRLRRDVISAFSRGLSENTTLEVLSLKGNLMDWEDLAELCEGLESSRLQILDISHNRIHKHSEIASKEGPLALLNAENHTKNVFECLKRSSIGRVVVNDWFLESDAYNESLQVYISDLKQGMQSNLSVHD